MTLAEWALVVGALLVTMVLAGTLLGRLPLSSAMVYLALGWLLGPDVADVLRPDPLIRRPSCSRRVAEAALLISLFAVGLRLGVPLRDRRWRLPLRLAFVSMAAMVAMVAALGVWLLGLPLGRRGPARRHPCADRPGARRRRADRRRRRSPTASASASPPKAGSTTARRSPSCMLGLGLLGLHPTGRRAAALVERRSAVGDAGRHRDRRGARRGHRPAGRLPAQPPRRGGGAGRVPRPRPGRHGLRHRPAQPGLGLPRRVRRRPGAAARARAAASRTRARWPRPDELRGPPLCHAGHAFAPCQRDDARLGAGLQRAARAAWPKWRSCWCWARCSPTRRRCRPSGGSCR